MFVWALLWIIAAYLMGSLSSAIIVCRLGHYPDPRGEGSGNPGATNVLRIAGKGAAALTLLGDVLKGLIPMLISRYLFEQEWLWAATMLAAFAGHLYPVFFGFQGGKGVATAFGAMLGASWLIGLAVLAGWLVVAWLSRISSLSALLSAALAPLYMIFLASWQSNWMPAATAWLVVVLIWRHRDNIANIMAGSEKRIGKR